MQTYPLPALYPMPPSILVAKSSGYDRGEGYKADTTNSRLTIHFRLGEGTEATIGIEVDEILDALAQLAKQAGS